MRLIFLPIFFTLLPLMALPATAASHQATPTAPTVIEPFKITDEAEFFSLLDLNRPGMESVKSAVEAKDWKRAKQAWADHLKNRTDVHWFWSFKDKAVIKRILDEKKQPLSRFIPSANNALERKFTFQGIPKTLDHSPEWRQGANEWTSVLNRCAYFNDLGYAYWATGDNKYAEDFVFLLKDWIRKNRVPEDVSGFVTFGNPWRALEDGLRVQSWLNALQLFREAPAFDAETIYQLTQSLAEHARYLRAVDSQRGYRAGNWQVVEATGSAFVGMMLPEFRESVQWRKSSFSTLTQHMVKDVNPDGAHYELTPGYHAAVMDQFLQVSLLSKKNGYTTSGLLDRHEKMYEFLLKISKPNRRQPPLGDAGNQSVERSLADGALLYNRPDMRFFSGNEGPANWVWNFGADAFDRYAKLAGKAPDFTSVLLPDAKYAMMRTGWEPTDSYTLFDMAPWRGGHSHQDRLQVIVYAGRDLLLDTGQYAYDEPLAKDFRKSAAHNVVLIDGAEQPAADPNVLAWQTTPRVDLAAGSIEAKGQTHQRTVLFLKPEGITLVVDHVRVTGPEADKEHEITRLFHFPPSTIRKENNIVQTTYPDGKNLQVQSLTTANLELREGWIPVAPAKADKAPVAAFVTKARLPQMLVTILTPFANAKDLPKAEMLPGSETGTTHLRLTYPEGRKIEITVAEDARKLEIGKITGTGRALIVWTDGGKDASQVLGGELTARKNQGRKQINDES